jgi:hypothetical protein
MKNLTTLLIICTTFLYFGCGKIKESVQKKVDEKVNEQVEKTKQEIDKEMQKADSISRQSENLDKETKIKAALEEEKLINDEKGQWAIDAEASSQYAPDDAEKTSMWMPFHATGKPNCETYGDNGNAWVSKEQDKGIEWIKLTYKKAVNATEVRVRQNYGPGAIIKIDLIDELGKNHTVFEEVDKTKYKDNSIVWMITKFEKTDYKTKTLKITLATNSVPGWNEIDAVQLIGE